MTVGLIDSGIGGLSILETAHTQLPRQQYVYLSDQINFPYSERNTNYLTKIAKKHVQVLLKQYNCNPIILACNTLTVAALENLRREFPTITFIGTVPAIKVAANVLSEKSPVLVLASQHTARSLYLRNLLQNYPGPNWTVVGSTTLVKAIETNNQREILQTLQNIKNEFPTNFSGIVLGCTHFPLASKQILKVWPQAQLFSPSIGVSKQLMITSLAVPTIKHSKQVIFLTTPGYVISPTVAERYYARL